jgi:DNA repair exonuclease SbcCD nuclease subunit
MIPMLDSSVETPVLRGVVSSDWHLGSMKTVLGPRAIDVQLREIDKVYRYAAKFGIEHLFVPGDAFDTPTVEPEALIGLIRLLKTYQGVVKTYYLLGNHDVSEKGRTSLDILASLEGHGMLPDLHVYTESAQLFIDGVMVSFLPYPHLKSLPHPTHPDLGCLNFVHVEQEGAVDDNGRKLSPKTSYTHGKNDFTISGHIHAHQVLANKAFVYVGSLYQKTFAEQLPKGFIDFMASYADDGRVRFRYKFVKTTPSVLLKTIKVTTDEELSAARQVTKADPTAKYRLVVADDLVIPADWVGESTNIVKTVGIKHYENNSLYADKLRDLAFDPESTINPLLGLPDFMKSRGHRKNDIAVATTMVKDALSVINVE